MILRLSWVLVLALSACAGEPAPSSCAANNCLGCCDESGQCQFGKSDVACGVAGQQCNPCSLATHCTASGFCEALAVVPQSTPPAVDGGRPDAGHPDAGTVPFTPGSACAGTTTQCGSSCRDLAVDENNCGSCGRECPSGLVCNRGNCQTLPADCTTSACPGDFGCNPETRHCTSGCFANSDCRGDAVCMNGTCRCASGEVQCGNVCAWTSNSNCSCPLGSEGRGGDCVDIDECARGTDTCPAASICINEGGSYRCECPPGFIGAAGQCEVDECATNNGGCGTHATCEDYPGFERYCQCDFGYSFDGTTCTPTCTAGLQNCVDAALACYPGAAGGSCLPPGGATPGSLCRANQDCQRGLGCTLNAATNVGVCEATCYNSCATGYSCVGSLCRPAADTACQPLAQDCASSYLGCYLGQTGATCVYAGSLSEGQSCQYINDCSGGHVCVSATATPTDHRCRAFCDPTDPAGCPTGKTCGAITGTALSACL